MMESKYSGIVNVMTNGMRCINKMVWENEEGDVSNIENELIEDNLDEYQFRQVLKKGMPVLEVKGAKHCLMEPFFPAERLIVLGAGHIAVSLVEFAAKTGFNLVVVDDRISFVNSARFPLAKKLICNNFSDAIQELNIQNSDYVVILTRGHRFDAECLRCLDQCTEPRYVGMIGSKRRVEIVKKQLKIEGLDSERLERIHTPIGFKIGAITPEEISISILAEIIKAKRIENNQVVVTSDIDFDVLENLVEKDEPKALITIIKSMGSVPRGAGAKMVAYRDGRIVGSIGGGCSEAGVLMEARNIIGTGKYKIIHVDLTGENAEDDGMVCGGKLTVLVEDFIIEQ